MTDDIQKQIDDLIKQVDELKQAGKFDEALPLAQKACDMARDNLGEEHPDFAKSLSNLGVLYAELGNYSQAEFYFKRVMELRRRILGEEHPDFARSLNNLGVLYENMGNYSDAESNYTRAVGILRSALGDEHPGFAQSLSNLSNFYLLMGNYPLAESNYKQAMEIFRNALGEGHPDYAQSLSNLGNLYFSMGNYPLAESYFIQAMDIRRNALGKEHPSVFASLDNLGRLYCEIGDYSKAESCHLQALETERKILPEGHPGFAVTLNNLGRLHLEMGSYSSSESDFKQAMEICRKALGEEHPHFAVILHNLGNLYIEMGNYQSAESLLMQSKGIMLNQLGERHPNTAESLLEIGKICSAVKSKTEAWRYFSQASDIHDYLITQIFSFASEAQRMEYLKKIQPSFDIQLSLVNKYLNDSADIVHSTLDLVLRRKAIGAEALAAQHYATLCGKYPELEEKLNEFTMLRMMIAMKEFKGPGREGREMHDKLISEWTGKKEQLESQLVRHIPEMNLEGQLRKADRKAVAQALPQGSVLVEFVKFNEFDFNAIRAKGEKQWKPARYLAFVLPASEPENVQMIDLGDAEAIDKLIDDFRASILGELDSSTRSCSVGLQTGISPENTIKTDSETVCASGNALRNVIFDRIENSLKGCKRLFLSPDGNLSRVPFEVLPTGDGRFLVDDYHISYLSVGRDVLRFGAKSSGIPEGALVAADPDFDMGIIEPSWEKEPVAVFNCTRSWRNSRDLDRSTLNFARLPGTRPESEKVSNILKTKPLLDCDVLEGKIKSIHSPYMMHLATHGFFLEDQKVNLEKETGSRYENPLLRSGLALAGANTFIKGGILPEEAEDGILTAEDVSGLDLLGTELVVLSACETGLGEVRTGEGVFGLRRAFMLAGSKTLVMSLWKVTDLATPILMECFYDNLLNGKLARDESLREAQLYLRGLTIKEIREKWLTPDVITQLSSGNEQNRIELEQFLKLPDNTVPFVDPLYWGAFICQGDPSPIKV